MWRVGFSSDSFDITMTYNRVAFYMNIFSPLMPMWSVTKR